MKKSIILSLILILLSAKGFSQGYSQEGFASIYPDNHEAKSTASGEKYGFRKATCAHLNLPFGTLVKVTNLENKTSTVLRVNDRGPFVPDRIIQISKSAAEKLNFLDKGVTKVRIETVEEDGQPVVMPSAVSDMSKLETAKTQTEKADTSKKQEIKAVDIGNDFYKLDISKLDPSGFSIQIGNFKELANLLKLADEAKIKLKKEIYVQVSNTSGEKIYRLLFGKFTTKADAEKQKENVSKFFPGCFIIELKK